jgi:tetratricopeptide (TPR) repeat protein
MCINIKVKLNIWFVVVVLVFASHTVQAQISADDKNKYLDADYYFYIKEYGKALDDLLILHTSYPDHGNINYLIGVCYILGSNDAEKALPYLETATKLVSENYRPGDLKLPGSPPDTWLYYGDVLHSGQQYDEASLAYHNYLKLVQDDEFAKRIAKRRIMGLGISYEGYLRPSYLVIENIGIQFNTEGTESRPVVSGDGQTMIYTTSKGVSLRIYYSQKKNKNWIEPVDITRELGSDGSFYVSSVSYNGDKIFLVKQDKMNSELYESSLKNGTWTKAEALHKRINSAFNESSACVTKDGSRLFFSSDKPGGYGGLDIYYSDLSKGSWGKPINIEAPINTSFDDDFPVISNSEDTLYFSTNGRESIGKMDIFISVKSEEGIWGTPKNIGTPYNTVENDYLGMFIKKDKETYVSQIRSDGIGQMDVFHIYKEKNEELAEITSDIIPEPVAKNNVEAERMEEPGDFLDEEGEMNVADTEHAESLAQQQEQSVKEEIVQKEEIEERQLSQLVEAPITNLSEEGDKMNAADTEHKEPSAQQQEQSEKTEIVQKEETTKNQFVEKPIKSISEEENLTSVDENAENNVHENIVEYNEKAIEDSKEEFPVVTDQIKEPESEVKASKETISSTYNFGSGLYTIQLMALRQPKNKNIIRNIELQRVKLSIGNDGYTRYTFGEYNTILEAQSTLKKLWHAGHVNAFIRETSSIDNY